ncbi:hypothetical protein ACOSP7_000886 [Xanthoceras sorbifolium]
MRPRQDELRKHLCQRGVSWLKKGIKTRTWLVVPTTVGRVCRPDTDVSHVGETLRTRRAPQSKRGCVTQLILHIPLDFLEILHDPLLVARSPRGRNPRASVRLEVPHRFNRIEGN